MLQNIPIDLLEDSLLPALDLQSLLRLSATSRSFRRLVTSANSLWRFRLAEDFNCGRLGARQDGFLDLYRRVSTSTVRVWGCSAQGRLGLSAETLREATRRDRLFDGIVTPLALQIDATVVAIEAGGWSIVARDTSGKLWIAGCLDAEAGFAGPHESFTNSSRIQSTPVPLPVSLPPLKSHACGRAHILAIDKSNAVYELSSFGQASRVHDSEGRWLSGSGIATIVAGWSTSAVLLRTRRAFVWWAETARNRFNEEDPEEPRRNDSSSIYAVYDRLVHSVELPSLPHSLEGEEPEAIEDLALGDNFAVALSSKGRIYKLSLDCPSEQHIPNDTDGNRERYDMAVKTGRIAWTCLPLFVGSTGTRITHIAANYRHFAAISTTVSPDSLQSTVMLGDSSTSTSSSPVCPPALQNVGVISMGMGDHHFTALTRDGRVLAFGEATKGRLGNRSTMRQARAPEPVLCEVPGFAWNIATSGWHSACLVLDNSQTNS